MDLSTARGIITNDAFCVSRDLLVDAARAMLQAHTDEVTARDGDQSRIRDLTEERDRATRLATRRQAVIDGHGAALADQRRQLLAEAEGVKQERDRLSTTVKNLRGDMAKVRSARDELAARASELATRVHELEQQTEGVSVRDRAGAKNYTDALNWLTAMFGFPTGTSWPALQQAVGQAVANQKRWKTVRAAVTSADKVTTGDTVTGGMMNPPGVGYTMRFDGTIQGPFRSYWTPAKD